MAAEKAQSTPGRVLARIVAAFLLMVVAFYALSTTGFFEARVFQPYLRLNAYLSGIVLAWLGYDVVVPGASIVFEGFSVSIARGCDASEPSALFVAALLAFPAPLVPKLWGILVGLLVLAMLNIVRIVSLYLVGLNFPGAFHMMHTEVWQVVFIAVAILLFCLWLIWSARARERRNVRA